MGQNWEWRERGIVGRWVWKLTKMKRCVRRKGATGRSKDWSFLGTETCIQPLLMSTFILSGLWLYLLLQLTLHIRAPSEDMNRGWGARRAGWGASPAAKRGLLSKQVDHMDHGSLLLRTEEAGRHRIFDSRSPMLVLCLLIKRQRGQC